MLYFSIDLVDKQTSQRESMTLAAECAYLPHVESNFVVLHPDWGSAAISLIDFNPRSNGTEVFVNLKTYRVEDGDELNRLKRDMLNRGWKEGNALEGITV